LQLELEALYINIRSVFFPVTGFFSYAMQLILPATYATSSNTLKFEAVISTEMSVDCVWNVMAHAQKSEFVFRRNGRIHWNRKGRQFIRLLTAEVCASAIVLLDTLPLPCVTLCHHVSTGL